MSFTNPMTSGWGAPDPRGQQTPMLPSGLYQAIVQAVQNQQAQPRAGGSAAPQYGSAFSFGPQSNPAGPFPNPTTNAPPQAVTPAAAAAAQPTNPFTVQPDPAGPIPSDTVKKDPGPSYQVGDPKKASDPPGQFDPLQYVAGLTAQQVTDPTLARDAAQQLFTYIQGLPIGQAETVMSELEKQKGGIQGTLVASDLASALSGKSLAPTAGGAAGGASAADPFGIGQAFTQVVPKFLSQEAAQGEKLDQAGATQLQQALKGASPAIQQAYGAIIPGMQMAQGDENRAMAGLALATPMFNEMLAGIQAMNTAYTQAKAAATQAPYVAATVQGTGLPGTGTQTNALAAGLQGPGTGSTTPSATGGIGGATQANTNTPGMSLNPYANLAYYLNLAQGTQTAP